MYVVGPACLFGRDNRIRAEGPKADDVRPEKMFHLQLR